MSDLLTVGYVHIEASDLSAWENFCVNFLGMQAAAKDSNQLKLRMDDRAYRVVIEQGPIDDLSSIGWEMINQQALQDYVDGLRAKGVDVNKASEELTASRQVKQLYTLQDPSGFTHEFYCDPKMANANDEFKSSVLGGNFVTDLLGFGHVTAMAHDYAASRTFYEDVLGLNISDYMTQEVAPGVILDAAFYHSETGRHHSLAVGALRDLPLPPDAKRIDHLMVEVDNVDDVGFAYERAKDMGIQITKSLGRHPNDQMLSFYVLTPSGFQFEFGTGGVVVESDSWISCEYDELSSWGHNPAH